MRSLSPDEAELWLRVTASIRPLSRDAQRKPPPTPEVTAASPAEGGPATNSQQSPKPKPKPKPQLEPKLAPGSTLDGTWDRRLRSGSVQPDRVLDLHGMNLDRAWWAIDDSLEQAIGAGERMLLLITGHQRHGEPPIARGKIRAAVHDWLAASRHARQIAAVRGAHPRHGGGGSLYIILRRR